MEIALQSGQCDLEQASRLKRASRQILKAFVAFRDGDFSARLPADWPGIDGRIAETFNQTIVREESFTERGQAALGDGRQGRPAQAAHFVARGRR